MGLLMQIALVVALFAIICVSLIGAALVYSVTFEGEEDISPELMGAMMAAISQYRRERKSD